MIESDKLDAFRDGKFEEFLLPAQRRIKSFVEYSKKRQTLYANCEGAYNRRLANVNDTNFLDRFINCTFFCKDDGCVLNAPSEERSMITKMRNEMIKTAAQFATPGEVHFSVVWVYYYDYNKLKTQAMPLLKVYKRTNSPEAVFLDPFLNKYDGWEYYLDNAVLSKSFLCVPRNGNYVFYSDSNSLDLIYVFSKGSPRNMPLLSVKGIFAPFCEKVISPVLSVLKDAKWEVVNFVQKLVSFVVDVWEDKKTVMVRVISLLSLGFRRCKIISVKFMEDFVNRALNIFCMFLNKTLTSIPALVHSGEGLIPCFDEKQSPAPYCGQKLVQLFQDFFKELDFDGLLLGLGLISKMQPAFEPFPCIHFVLFTTGVIVEVVKAIRSCYQGLKGKDFPALGFGEDSSIRIPTFENYQATVDNRSMKVAEEIVTSLKEMENTSCLKIADTAYEKAGPAQSNGFVCEPHSDSSPPNAEFPGSVHLLASATLPKFREQFQSIMKDFTIKPRNQVVYDFIDNEGRVVGTFFEVNKSSGITYVPGKACFYRL